MPTSKLFTPREAAQVLAVSYPTLKQWIYKKKIRSVKTAGGHHRIPEKEVDRFLHRATEGGDVTFDGSAGATSLSAA
jgi:excisionase family DNA binding protein